MSNKELVIRDALQLSDSERAEVAEALYESLDGRLDGDAADAWAEEIERRLKQLDSGGATLVPWPEARRRIAGDEGADGAAR